MLDATSPSSYRSTMPARADRSKLARCAWCGRGFRPTEAKGRMPRYCRRSCRQRAYESRQRAGEVGLNESELIVTRSELEHLYDQLWVLECAIDDVQRDLADSATLKDHRAAMAWLLDAAKPLVALRR
jgi:hypothetical protein